MNFFDLIIIYLACGAPFGVYYFLNHRSDKTQTFFKTIFVSVFWVPFAYRLLKNYVLRKQPDSALSKEEFFRNEQILKTKKSLENILVENKSGVQIFELREVLDRYCGLTEAVFIQDDSTITNSQLFEVAGNQNVDLAAKCFQRRNRKLLFFHQTLASQDFVKTIWEFILCRPNEEEVEKSSLKLVRLLNDESTEKTLKMLFKNKKQSNENICVQKPENESWINDLQQPLTVNALQISVNSASTTMNSSLKD